jgi:hypothetical protein
MTHHHPCSGEKTQILVICSTTSHLMDMVLSFCIASFIAILSWYATEADSERQWFGHITWKRWNTCICTALQSFVLPNIKLVRNKKGICFNIPFLHKRERLSFEHFFTGNLLLNLSSSYTIKSGYSFGILTTKNMILTFWSYPPFAPRSSNVVF